MAKPVPTDDSYVGAFETSLIVGLDQDFDQQGFAAEVNAFGFAPDEEGDPFIERGTSASVATLGGSSSLQFGLVFFGTGAQVVPQGHEGVQSSASVDGPSTVNASLGVPASWDYEITDPNNEVAHVSYLTGDTPGSGWSWSDPGGPGPRTAQLVWDGTGSVSSGVVTARLPVGASYLRDPPDYNAEEEAYIAQGYSVTSAIKSIEEETSSKLDTFTTYTGPDDADQLHNGIESDLLENARMGVLRTGGVIPNPSWTARQSNMLVYARDDFLGQFQANELQSAQHMQSVGLCRWYEDDGSQDSAVLNAIQNIGDAQVSWFNTEYSGKTAGDPMFPNNGDGRRFARLLDSIVAIARVTQDQDHIDHRDNLLDLIMETSDWLPAFNMYTYGSGGVDNQYGAGAFANGDRCFVAWHSGSLARALICAWRQLVEEGDLRQIAVRRRIIDYATHFRDFGLEADGNGLQLIPQNPGRNINSGDRTTDNNYDAPSFGLNSYGVYNYAVIDLLVWAYKFTGDQTYLDTSWTCLINVQRNRQEDAGSNDIYHYMDTLLAGGGGQQQDNKGRAQYQAALYENNGSPTVLL